MELVKNRSYSWLRILFNDSIVAERYNSMKGLHYVLVFNFKF